MSSIFAANLTQVVGLQLLLLLAHLEDSTDSAERLVDVIDALRLLLVRDIALDLSQDAFVSLLTSLKACWSSVCFFDRLQRKATLLNCEVQFRQMAVEASLHHDCPLLNV